MTLHERREKNSPLHTILYEIDLIRHCALTVSHKKAHAEQSGEESAKAEYYLTIEGFLLHLRNLLAFFTNRSNDVTDLIINKPEVWAGRPIAQRDYSDLIKRAKEVDAEFGSEQSSGYDQISKFLQHCTTFRHERARKWEIGKIFALLDPILQDFEKRYAASAVETVTVLLGEAGLGHTATFRKIDFPGPSS